MISFIYILYILDKAIIPPARISIPATYENALANDIFLSMRSLKLRFFPKMNQLIRIKEQFNTL
jgi:hypothetical protein